FSTLSLFSSSSASSYFSLFFFYSSGDHRHLHSFPHDALPISWRPEGQNNPTTALSPTRRSRPDISKSPPPSCKISRLCGVRTRGDRKSTLLNSSHLVISYAVFCLKKKNITLKSKNMYYVISCL